MTPMHGFELIRRQEIPELKTQASLFRHRQTGAELLSLENDDENKVFGITFRTPPPDSTGVAHIMEHTVLCGSRKYPVKDPFVQMIKGSLNTFLNALTFPDKTCYPVASTNLQDFYNLIEVYLDAVFYPLLTPHKFQQEGWHYELEKPGDTPVFKGIVFNEMKGAYSAPDRLLGEYAQQSLFPGHVYGVDSGGHPHHIPDLTYEQFTAFHKKYYHPSNARLYFYGDDDPARRLQIAGEYLKDFDRQEIDSAIPLHRGAAQPQNFLHSFQAGEETNFASAGRIMVNWLFPEARDPVLMLELSLMSYLLLGTSAAPLYKALIDSGLGEDVTGGMEAELRQMYFSAGLKGIAVENKDQVETLIFETLRRLTAQGLDPHSIEAALNTVEFRLREKNTGSYPRGLSVMFGALTTWLHGGDPLAPLAYEAPLATVKERAQNQPRYFEAMIVRYLLENAQRTTVVLAPDSEIGKREEEAEKKRLAETAAKMSDAERQAMAANTAALKQWQEASDSPEALATLPFLKRSDLERENKKIPREMRPHGGTPILYHDLFTNGIVYLEAGFNLRSLPQELLPYLPLFSRGLLQMGTKDETFVQLTQRIGRKTGGLWPNTFVSMRQGADTAASWLFLRGKAMRPQAEELLAILHDVLLTARLDDRDRFRQLVLDEKSGMESSLVPHGSGVVSARLSARFHEAGWLSEQMGGVTYLFFVRRLAEMVDSDWPAVLAALEKIRSLLVNRQHMLCNVTLEAANYAIFEPQLHDFLETLPATPGLLQKWSPKYETAHEGLTIPAQVNYVGKGANLYRHGYKFHGSAFVITNFLRTTWLWERVRMQGGAYGGSCGLDRRSGVFNFVSYRDPNLLKTLENYDAASRFLREVDLSEEELIKSIIGTIGDFDAYQLADAKGYTSMARYLTGDTDEERQRLREEVLATTVQDFRAFAEALQNVNQHGTVVVLGSPAAIAAANEEKKDWLKVTKVL